MSNLDIRRTPATNSWIAVQDELAAVNASEINVRTQRLIDQDLDLGALEGETEERKSQVRKRAAWLADKFIRSRVKEGRLCCDACDFDPAFIINTQLLSARGALDVHHKFPLEEGTRYTSVADFALLCPTCHRIEHQLMKKSGSLFSKGKTPHLFRAHGDG